MHDPGTPTTAPPATGTPAPPPSSAPTSPAQRQGIRIGLFAGMAEAAGCRSLDMAWNGGTAAALRLRLADALPHLAPLLARSAVAIGDAYVTDDAPIPAGSDVAIIPPVSGG